MDSLNVQGRHTYAPRLRMTYRTAMVYVRAAAVFALCAGCQDDPEPSSSRLDVERASALVAGEDQVTVLDVRTPEEFEAGHIPGARNAPMQEGRFDRAVGQLDRTDAYLVHCQAGVAGGRAEQALQRLQQLGFAHLYHLEGGFGAWAEAGKPVVE